MGDGGLFHLNRFGEFGDGAGGLAQAAEDQQPAWRCERLKGLRYSGCAVCV